MKKLLPNVHLFSSTPRSGWRSVVSGSPLASRLGRTKRFSKQLLAVFLILIIFTGVAMKFWTKEASAAWFDENWGYRQAATVTVASNGSDIKNLETLLTVDTSTLISAGKLQSSCQDLRFTNNSGKLLPYYIDSGCNTSTTKVWVMVDTVPANTTTYTMYQYYGNPSAPAGTDSQKFNLFRGLVGYWGMNEASWNGTASEVKDFSVNANNGTAVNGATTASGKYSNAGFFDGTNDYVNLGSSAIIGTSTTFTISAWINLTNLSTKHDIFNEHPTTYAGSSQNTFRINTDGTMVYDAGFPPSGGTVDSTGIVPTSTWTHVMVTRAGSAVTYYINGANAGTYTVSEVYSGNAATVPVLGAFRNSAGTVTNLFAGSIDDFRIYNRALSPTEVGQLYQNPGTLASYASTNSLPTTSFATEERAPQPVAYWKFDEGTGTSANDSTSNKNNGTLVNMATSPSATNSGWLAEDNCVSGKCLAFDGIDDYVTTPTSAPMGSTFTLSVWFKQTGFQSNPSAFAKDIFGNNANGCDLYDLNGTMAFYAGSSTGLGNPTPIPYVVGAWNHVVVTASGTNASIYLNGVLKGSSSNFSSTCTNKRIGGGSASRWFTGFIDEVKLYPYVRTTAQIKADYASRGSALGASAVLGNNANNNLAALSQGLVGYWKMNEATWSGMLNEVLDSSGNGNNGQAFGATNAKAYPAVGKFGNGGVFDGVDDYVQMPDSSTYRPTTALTASVWMKSSGSTNGRMISTNSTSNVGYDCILLPTSGRVQCDIGLTSGQKSIFSTSGVNLADNVWHQITETWDGSVYKLYVDGLLVSTVTGATGTISYSGGKNFTIGNHNGLSTPYSGSIDEVRVYNRGLSSYDVANLYNWAPGPVGYWNFNEHGGSIANDRSGNGNAGAITGAPWITGKYGSGLSFNSTSARYVSIPDPANGSLDFGVGAMSYELWMRIPAAPSATVFPIDKKVGGSNAAGYQLNLNATQLYCKWGNGTTTFISAIANPTTMGLFDNKWHHVACIYSRGTSLDTTNIYVDGKSQGKTITSNIFNLDSSFNLVIGTITNLATAGQFPGELDEVRIYNYDLTAKQVQEDMQAGAVVTGSGKTTVGYWKFDEGYGDSANDSSPAKHNGDLAGSGTACTGNSGACPTWRTDGKFGKALSFDGSDYITLTNPIADFQIATKSASMWVNIGAVPGATQILLGSSSNWYIGVTASGGTARMLVSYFTAGNIQTTVTSTTAIPLKTWNHLTYTFSVDANGVVTIRFFLNGKLIQTTTNTTGYGTVYGATLFMGSVSLGGANSYVGLLDEVKFSNYELTPDEVKIEYNRGSAQVLGGLGTDTTGVASNSASTAYCIPGDSTSCSAPVAEWNFEEGSRSTVSDISGNNNTLTWSGAGSRVAPGKVGKAAAMNGVDDYLSTSLSSVDFSTSYTVSQWIKADRYGDSRSNCGNKLGVTFAKQTSYYGVGFYSQDSTQFTYSHSKADLSANTVLTSSLSLHAWNLMTAVYDATGNAMKLYRNGQLVQTVNTTGITYINPSGPLYIGGHNANCSFGYPLGAIDDTRIYNYARSAAQVAWDYNRGGPVARWKMDECQGGVLTDASGNGNTGTITIGATGTQTALGTCQTSGTAWGNGAIGKFNSSLSFDGTDDYVSFSRSPSIQSIATSGTISAWMYNSVLDSTLRALVDITTTGANGLVLWSNFGTNKPTISYGNGSSLTSLTAVGTFTTGTWYHVVGTWDASGGKIYINGKLNASNATAPVVTVSSGTGYIGSNNGTMRYHSGQIDDVQIYNYTLTPSQIKLLYNQNAAVRFGPVTGTP